MLAYIDTVKAAEKKLYTKHISSQHYAAFRAAIVAAVDTATAKSVVNARTLVEDNKYSVAANIASSAD